MAVSIVQSVSQAGFGVNDIEPVTIPSAPAPGDVVVLIAESGRASGARLVNSVSGLGATWASGYRGGNSRIHYWIGTGATSSGDITALYNGIDSGTNFRLSALVVRGLTSTAVTGYQAATTGTSLTGPSMAVGLGQLAISSTIFLLADATPFSTFTPGTGWVSTQKATQDGLRCFEVAYYIGATSESVRTDVVAASSVEIPIAGIVLGDVAPATTLQAFTGAGVTRVVSAGAGSFVATIGSTPQAFTGAAVTVAVTAGAGSFAAATPVIPQAFTGKGVTVAVSGSPSLSAMAASVTVATVAVLDVVTLSAVTLGGGGTVTVADLATVTILTDVTLGGGATLTARPHEDVVGDPRTGLAQWRYVVTDLQGAPLGELVDIEHDAIEDGVNEPTTMSFTIPVDDEAYPLIKPVVRQCQVWHGNQLRLRGPILPGNISEDGATVTHTVHDPSWWWRDGRKRIGWVPKTNLLKNGDFTQGLNYWTRGFDKDSIPAAAPTVRVVADDFTDGGKAAEIAGVETVTMHETELESSAVYWPNRPFASEPLAAGFRPGGGAAIDAVATAMPTTAGLKVSIVGHTANDGTGNGLELSVRRALAAKARVLAIRPAAVVTTTGVGFYQPNPKYPVDSQQQRRVVIGYESTTTIDAKSKQWLRQTVTVTQPKSAAYGLELVGAAWLKVTDDWSVQDANMVSVRVVARRQDRPTTIWADESSSISDTDPVGRWMKATASVTIPADDRPYLVDVYLYAPAALTRYTRAVLEPQELLYFWGKDQALIVKGIVEHMQDPRTMLGATWPITVGTRTPLSGVARDREYPHSAREPIDTALEEFPSLYRGLDIDVLTTPTATTVATFYPQQGQTIDYPLVLGGNISRAVPATTRDVASLVIAQAQDSSSARDEAYAGDKRALGGLMLQSLITAEQDTPLNELDETAANELRWAKVDTAAYWLDVDPESIAEVLAETAKGDTVRLLLDGPLSLDELVRIVKREIHPDGLRLMVARQET